MHLGRSKTHSGHGQCCSLCAGQLPVVPIGRSHSSLLFNPHHLPSSRHGQPTHLPLLVACACRALLRWHCIEQTGDARSAFSAAAMVTRRVWIRPDQCRSAPPCSCLRAPHDLGVILPDFEVASSCSTGASATSSSSCFCLFPSQCMHLEWTTRLTPCCRTSRPGSDECSWNLLQAACVLHYPVDFLSAEQSYLL